MQALTGYNAEAELSFLGMLLQYPEYVKDAFVIPEELTPGKNSNLFKTIIDLDKKNIPIDTLALLDRVGESNMEALGGVAYIRELSSAFVSESKFVFYQNLVLDASRQRKANKIAEEIKEGADIAEASMKLAALQDRGQDDDDAEIKEALVAMYDDIESADGTIKGIPSGFHDLDKMTGGYKGGDLIVVGARPSVGKTAFAINTALNAVASPDNPEGDIVAIISLEMGKVQLLKRAAAAYGNIDMQRMKYARTAFTGKDWNSLTMAMGHLGNADLKILDKGRTLSYIYSNVRKLRRQNPNRRIMVIIDYLQLIVGSSQFKGNRTAEIGDISMNLKHMAREFDIPVIALSQLSRGVEQRQDKRPMMSDLRESGQIEQDADIIQFLYREDYYDKETEDQNIIEVIMAKQRDGAVGTVKLSFIKEYGKFINIDWGGANG